MSLTARQIDSRPQRLGAFLKREFWPEDGWCREDTEDISYAADMGIGAVLVDANDDGTYELATAANLTATILGRGVRLLIDNEVYDQDRTVGTDYDWATLARGPAIVMEQGFQFSGAAPNATQLGLLIDQLEDQQIQVQDRV